ncbi:MAG TPA: TIGR04290 family methyltransferase [Terriglobales bacterium]|jgi:tRNA (mo5U34)-methyltransferase
MSSTPDILSSNQQVSNSVNPDELARRIAELGDWFHNLDLCGVRTAPDHFLGDFPNVKWRDIAKEIPVDLSGASVLDVGCNGGFYSIQMKQRGATRVLGVDVDDRYLNQARFAADTLKLDIEFQKLSVYAIDEIEGQFDYVLFMGIFYHLRYPVFALDKVITKVKHRLIFQTMIRGSEDSFQAEADYGFWEKKIFSQPNFPAMYFIENSYSNDYTNWWIPNRAAVEGVLRSSGLQLLSHPEAETWICAPHHVLNRGRYILDRELDGTL